MIKFSELLEEGRGWANESRFSKNAADAILSGELPSWKLAKNFLIKMGEKNPIKNDRITRWHHIKNKSGAYRRVTFYKVWDKIDTYDDFKKYVKLDIVKEAFESMKDIYDDFKDIWNTNFEL